MRAHARRVEAYQSPPPDSTADVRQRGSYAVKWAISPHGFPHGTLGGQVSASLATHSDTSRHDERRKCHRKTAVRSPVWGVVAGQGT